MIKILARIISGTSCIMIIIIAHVQMSMLLFDSISSLWSHLIWTFLDKQSGKQLNVDRKAFWAVRYFFWLSCVCGCYWSSVGDGQFHYNFFSVWAIWLPSFDHSLSDHVPLTLSIMIFPMLISNGTIILLFSLEWKRFWIDNDNFIIIQYHYPVVMVNYEWLLTSLKYFPPVQLWFYRWYRLVATIFSG